MPTKNMYIIQIASLVLITNTHIFDKKYKKYIGHRLFPGHLCICNRNPISYSNNMKYFLKAYFIHTNIFKMTVNYFVIPIFISGSKMMLKMPISKKKMLIFNTIFGPTGKNWGDPMIYSLI